MNAAPGGRLTATRHPLIEAVSGRPLPPLPRNAWLEIDLDALVSNVRLLQGMLPAGARLNAVVKADAYGHGAVPVARAITAAGVAMLSVATFDEGVELRQAGITVPILVLFSIPPGLVPDAIRYRLSVTASDRVILERMLAELSDLSPAMPGEKLSIHVEVETGLGRGGLDPADVPAAADAIEAEPRACLAGLWSHLQAAGKPDLTTSQAEHLGEAAHLLEDASVALPARHLAASGGVLASSAPSFDMVRIGLSLYGFVPDGLTPDPGNAATAAGLRPIMSLRARPIRVADLTAGTGVSYGPTFVTGRPSRIATLPLGYADGIPRSLSNKAKVLVRGQRAPLVGTVAMDAVMIDVTDVSGPPVSVDDEFTLLGTQGSETIDAFEMAQWGNTISYEIVTGMSGRLPRVYYAAAKAAQIRTVACQAEPGGAEAGRSSTLAGGEEPGPLGCE
jgi:alanine racemase